MITVEPERFINPQTCIEQQQHQCPSADLKPVVWTEHHESTDLRVAEIGVSGFGGSSSSRIRNRSGNNPSPCAHVRKLFTDRAYMLMPPGVRP
jgi:hypothetical protein